VWTSPDGLHWTREPAVAAFEHAYMSGVAHGDGGSFAVGAAVDKLRPPSDPVKSASLAAVWTSSDVKSWSRVPDAGIAHSSNDDGMLGVAAGAGGLVAIGSVTGADRISGAAWWSADGTTWKQAIGDFSGSYLLGGVAVTPTGYLVIGSPVISMAGSPSPTPSPATARACPSSIWSSLEGRAFTCVEGPRAEDSFKPLSIAASSSLEVLVGEDTSGGAVWVRTLP
jgi:hypothetical protein